MKKYLFLITSFLTALVASGATYYVVPGGAGSKNGTSWANAYADVQTAIDSASNAGGGEVWIAKGTYKHGSAMTMKNNVRIYGGFAGTETSKDQRTSGNNTILDGECKYRVFYNYYYADTPLTNSAKLDNVTIQNGYTSGSGAGMCNNYASPEITNCTFANNSASSSGGGMYNDYYSSPVLTNCTFSGNSANAVSESYGGGGMYNRRNSSPVLTNCTFSGNSASRGGVMYNYSPTSPTLTNCILWGNTASSSGKEIYNDDSENKPTIDTCIIEGGYSSYGTYRNIITADPKLMPLGNYGGSVQTCPVGAGSSAIGKGKKMSGVTTDARGFVRSTTPTIGACEYQNKLVSTITTTEGYLKYSSSYEFTLNVNVSDIDVTKVNLTYQWYKDGVAIKGATLSSYKTSQDAGTSKYYVEVSDGSTTITSSEIAIEAIDICYYVSTEGSSENDGLSWATAKSDVQEAIDLASKYCGSEVWIAKGTYKHGSQMTMKNNVAIYGGFAGTETSKDQRVAGNNTILDGEGKYRVFYNHYSSSNKLTNSAKLDNVTIQNGYANDGNNNSTSTSDYGAGMYNYYASPEITNCTFSNNSAYDGGGMYNYNSSSPVLTNCTFTNNYVYYYGGGMFNRSSSSPVLTNCTFSNNRISGSPGLYYGYGGGMYNYESSSPKLINCTFTNNYAYYYGGGMYNESSSSPKLTNCILWGNTASSSGNEIYNSGSSSKPTIDTCIIKGGKSGITNSSYGTYTNIITADPKLMPLGNYGGSVLTCPVGAGSSAIDAGKVVYGVTTDARGFTRFSSSPTIGACEYSILDCDPSNPPFVKTEECIAKYSSSYEFTLNMFITGNNLTYQWYKDGVAIEGATSSSYKTKQSAGTSKYYVEVSDGSTTITSSEIAIETIDICYYVSTEGSSENDGLSWTTAKSDVQEAIDLASSHNAYGMEVWIAKGTYKHGSAMTMKNGVAIYGGFAGTETSKDQRVAGNDTILDGEGKYRVFYNYYSSSNPLTNSAKLDNVTIQNGYTTGDGAGMYNNYASPEITNCTFANNSASGSSYGGGGMYNSGGSPTLTNCTFSGNSASHGGGMYNGSSSPVLTNCTFTYNSASSRGGGMYNVYYSSPVLTNCTFANNSASSYGGGMYNYGNGGTCSPVLTNCTFSGNSASSDGGGMYNNSSSPMLTNCILWGNTANYGNEIYNYNSNCKPTIDTCIIKGGKDGISGSDYCTFTTEPITTDPKLMPLGNYGGSVQTCPVGAGSSAIGTGKVVENLTSDARGFARSSTPTIGACEYQNKLTEASISTQEGYLKYSSSYEFTLNTNVPDVNNNLTYQWYKDGVAISGATSSTYKTSQSVGTSKYTVVISDGTTTITSSEITIETINPIYVSTTGSSENDGLTWATTKSDVQEAIDLASEWYGSEVWIAQGTYKHGSAMTMKNNVAIYGGFAGTETSKNQRIPGNNTILDGEGKYRVFYNNYTESNPLTNSAKLDNVTIQNGYVDYNSGYHGAGMYNEYASPEITNCTFANNSASSAGGGMYNLGGSPTLTNCTFSGNSASSCGGMYNSRGSPTLTNCTFSGNSASLGGGMYNEYSSPTLTNCILWGNTASNSGNEIYNNSSNCNPTIDTCIIKGGVGDSYGTYTNIITADPKLMPLGNYGGSVQICPVGAGSSAIGVGKVVESVTTDARGFVRSTTPTIGACEYANKLTVASITISEGYLKYSSSYEFTLNALSEGTNLTYQWYKDGIAISGATSSSYKTSQSVGTSKYTVVISDGTTTITSSEITIETVNPVIYVSTEGTSENDGLTWVTAKSDIQEAIDLASSYNACGMEVWIAKGTYKHGSAMTMKNNVAIYGGFAGTETSKDQRVSGNNTILDGEGKYRVFDNSNIDNSAKLDNVTIQNASGSGMYNYYASPEITNCTFMNNSTSYYGGGMHNDSSSPVLTNCTFSGNSANGSSYRCGGGGMYNEYSSSLVLTNCTFSNNSAYRGGGMYNYNSSSPTLTNCILWGNTASSGNEIYNYNPNDNPTIDTCIIKGGYSSYGTYTNIITADPKLMPLGNYGGSVQTMPVVAGSSAIGASKVVESVTTDARGFARSSTPTIGACESILNSNSIYIETQEGYLKYSSSYEFTLNAISEGTNLTYQWYKDGEKIAGATSSTYKTSQSAGTSKYTVVVSDGTTSITSSEIVIETTNATRFYVSTEGSSSNDGLSWATAKNSLKEVLDYIGSIYQHDQIAIEIWVAKGIYKHGSAMIMKNNVAIYGGFAGTETSKEERIAGNNTIFDGEGKYRVFYNNCSSSNKLTTSAKLDNVTIQNGYISDHGAGMYNNYASPEITNCTFTNNSATGNYSYGGGMFNDYYSSPVLTNCTFSNNSADAGGGMYNSGSNPALTNCTFANNSASGSSHGHGGGMYNGSSSPTLTNCTFSGNSASGAYYGYGGGMYNSSSSPTLTNCILWGNTASSSGNEIYNNNSNCNPTIDTCIIKGGKEGIYNSDYCTFTTEPITADPKLMPLGNYGGSVQTMPVASGSSAIGAGKVVEGVTTDARGFIRSVPYTIGAWQYHPAEITSNLEDIAVWPNTDATLTVSIEGDNPTYQWQYSTNGSTWYDIAGETSSTLTLSNVPSSKNGYKYRCAVDSDNGDLTYSSVAILTVKPSPTLDNNPTGFEVWSNVDRSLSVSATGEEITYQWYFNGKAIEGATDSTLSLNSIQTSASGSYYCVIKNPAGSVQSSSATVIVRQSADSTTITKPLVDVITASNNGYACFETASSAYGTLSYTWYYKLNTSSYWNKLSETSNKLTIANETSHRNAQIKCVISNAGGSAETIANLTYTNDAIVFATQPESVHQYLYGSASFVVEATTSTEEIAYQWQKLSNGDWVDINGATNPTYTDSYIQSSDLTSYRCKVDNGANAFAYSNVATLDNNIVISQQPTASQILWENHKFELSVESQCNNIEYQWQYSSDNVEWANIENATSNNFSIEAVKPSDAGYYRCVISGNNWISITSRVSQLAVKPIGAFTENLTGFEVWSDTNQSLSVSATGEELTYQWYFNGEAIEGATESTLSFENIQFDKTGSYYCVITNPAGSVQSSSAEVVVHQSARITKGLTNVQAVKEIGYARFEIESDSYNPTIKWYVGGVEFTGEDLDEDPKVLFFNVGSTIRTTVKCVLSTADGKEVTSQANLMCIDASASNAPIKIAQQPTDTQPIAWGEIASFTASATAGSTVANYQWQISADSETWEDIEGANASTCSFKMEDYNKCFVRCEINNGNNSYLYTDVAKIMHSITPSEQTPDEMWLYDGDTDDVEFDFDVGEDGMKFQWQMSTDNGTTWVDIENADDDLFYITMSPDLDGVKVRCNYWTTTSQFTSNITTLRLATLVEITREPEVYESAKLYSTVPLTVEATGYNLQYQWQISQDGETWDDIENATSSKLNVFVSEEVAFNYYRCYVYNKDEEGNVRSEAYTDFLEHGIVFPSAEEDKFGKWAYDNKLESDNALPTATPHNDGITNLEKFTFGLDASKATSYDANVNFKHSTDASGASLQFPVSVDAEGVVNVKALKSTDLINWTEATATATGETSSDGKFKIYKATAPVGEEGKVFLKLKVEEK